MLTLQRQQLDSAFSSLAKFRRGQLVRRGGALSEDFEISFQHRGLEILAGTETGRLRESSLFVFTRHTKHPCRDEFAGEDESERKIPGFSVLIRRPRAFDWLRRLLRLRTVWTDRRRPGWFHIEEPLPVDISLNLPSLLADPIQAMASTARLDKLSISFTSRIFRANRRPILWEYEEIDSFVSSCLELLLVSLDQPPPTPAVLPATELVFLAGLLEGRRDVRCGVCGDELLDRCVTCAKCQTPHHRECWEYGGGCSVYACGSTRSV